MRIALLAGGTGGAKLAAGMQEVVGSDLTVIANTADDTRIHGLHVSPDPDLITYWLAGEIDEERGWGIRGDSFTVHERLEWLDTPDRPHPLRRRPPERAGAGILDVDDVRAGPGGIDRLGGVGHADQETHVGYYKRSLASRQARPSSCSTTTSPAGS